ncbi:MAG: hypothetical protein R3C03_13235 [Pirellulaceae bacterium]
MGRVGGTVSYTRRRFAVVVLDGDVEIFDVELSGIDNFNGASLTLSRNGGANSQDVYSSTGTLASISATSGNLVVGGTTIGTYTNSGGTLTFAFNGNATNTLVNQAMQQIAYSNSSDAPPASVQINWTFNDGGNSVMTQGSPGVLTATGSVTVNITATNDTPVVTAPGSAYSFTEQGSLNIHGTGFSVADVDDNGGVMYATFSVGVGRVVVNVGNSGVTVIAHAGSIESAGNGTDVVQFRGTKAQLNALLSGSSTGTIVYYYDQLAASDIPPASTNITLLINDGGNTGTDPGLTGTSTSEEHSASQTINITAFNDAATLRGSNLITNGDFSSSLTGWTTTGTVSQSGGSLMFGAGSAYGPHTASQSFATTVGESYIIEFDYRDNHLYGTRNQQLQVTVDGATNRLTTSQILTDQGDNTFVRYRFTFTADSTTSTLKFTDTSDNVGSLSYSTVGVEGLIDNVSVQQAGGQLGTVSYTEGGTAVVLDSDVTVRDAEITAGYDNFSGATLTLTRNGGANATDVFSNSGLLGTLTQGGNLVYNGTTIGTVTTNSGGTLLLTFNATATQSTVDAVMQSIAYSNSSDTPPSSIQLNWTFNDNNDGSQASERVEFDRYSVVNIAPTNDAPTFEQPELITNGDFSGGLRRTGRRPVPRHSAEAASASESEILSDHIHCLRRSTQWQVVLTSCRLTIATIMSRKNQSLQSQSTEPATC